MYEHTKAPIPAVFTLVVHTLYTVSLPALFCQQGYDLISQKSVCIFKSCRSKRLWTIQFTCWGKSKQMFAQDIRYDWYDKIACLNYFEFGLKVWKPSGKWLGTLWTVSGDKQPCTLTPSINLESPIVLACMVLGTWKELVACSAPTPLLNGRQLTWLQFFPGY